jgi:hypothetical protein
MAPDPPKGPTIDWSGVATHLTQSASNLANNVANQLKTDGPLLAAGTYDSKAFVADVEWFWTTLASTAKDIADCWSQTVIGTSP